MTVTELAQALSELPVEDQGKVVVCYDRLIDGVERVTQPIVWNTAPVDVIHLTNDLIDVALDCRFDPVRPWRNRASGDEQ